MDATRWCVLAVFCFAPGVLALDLGLWLCGRQLISEYVWARRGLEDATCLYLAAVAGALVLHFKWRWLGDWFLPVALAASAGWLGWVWYRGWLD